MIDLSVVNPAETLLIVSCTRKKIWDFIPSAPDFVPARYAYKGEKFINFIRWAEDNEVEKKGFFWVILSGKYGLLEPWHPILRHDVNFVDPASGPVSDETLKRQVNQKRVWRSADGRLIETSIADYPKIITVNVNEKYMARLSLCLAGKEVICVDMG